MMPLVRWLILGPTGVGKTEWPTLAAELLDNEHNMVMICQDT